MWSTLLDDSQSRNSDIAPYRRVMPRWFVASWRPWCSTTFYFFEDDSKGHNRCWWKRVCRHPGDWIDAVERAMEMQDRANGWTTGQRPRRDIDYRRLTNYFQ